MKDIKHIRRDFYTAAWFMHAPWVGLGGTMGGGGLSGPKKIPQIQPDLVCELLT